MKANALTVTFLAPISFASLNGSDKEVDNLSSIKKISVGQEQYPYVSAQAVRRALRDRIGDKGHELSKIQADSGDPKAPAYTLCKPRRYIDDDLFGYMHAKGRRYRTAPLRVSPLISLVPYRGDLDFGTNYMGKAIGKEPSIMETEIHAGPYRATILLELDRVGCGEGFDNKPLTTKKRAERCQTLLDAIKNLWSSGRQSRFLADISPKFIAASLLKAKVPVFLETVKLRDGALDSALLVQTVDDYKDIIVHHLFAAQKGLIDGIPDGAVSIGVAFQTMKQWVKEVF